MNLRKQLGKIPKVQKSDNSYSILNEIYSQSSQNYSFDMHSDTTYKENDFEKLSIVKPLKIFESIEEQNIIFERLKVITNNYQLKYKQIKDQEDLVLPPLQHLTKKEVQYIIRVNRQKNNRLNKGGKIQKHKNHFNKILGKRILKSSNTIQQQQKQYSFNNSQENFIQCEDHSLATLLLKTFHDLDKDMQLKIMVSLTELLNNDKEMEKKILQKQLQINLKHAQQMYQQNNKFELEQLFNKLHPICVVQLHVQLCLTNNTLTEEGNTLSRTLLPHLNKIFNYEFIQQQDVFILTRFLHSLVRHINDTKTQVGQGFIIFGLKLDPQCIQNIYENKNNIEILNQALQGQGFYKQSSKIISEHPQKFLWPEFMCYVKKQSQEFLLEKLQILNKLKIFRDPGQQMIIIDGFFDQRRVLVDMLLKSENLQITIEDLIQVLDNLKQLQTSSIVNCLQKDSLLWLQISTSLKNLQINEDQQIDQVFLDHLMRDNLNNVENPVTIEEMNQVSLQISQLCPLYRHNNYQCTMAAIIASLKDNLIIAVIPTGSGKTWIQALVSKYFCLQNKKVGLIEPNQQLLIQTSEKIGALDYSCTIKTIEQFYEYQFKEDVLICNEYDEIFINSHYRLINNSVTGIWQFKNKKVICFSATTNQALEKFVNNTISQPKIIKFKCEFEILQGISTIQNGNIIAISNQEKLLTQFYQDLIKYYDNKPIIIIYDDKEQKGDIQKFLIEHKMRWVLGGTELNISTIKSWEYGVLLLESNEVRGLDTKFALDAIVLILAIVETEMQYQQMIGRSSRTRGICDGILYVNTQQTQIDILQKLRQQNFHSFISLEMVHKLIEQKQQKKTIVEVLKKAQIDGILVKNLDDIQKRTDPKIYKKLLKSIHF